MIEKSIKDILLFFYFCYFAIFWKSTLTALLDSRAIELWPLIGSMIDNEQSIYNSNLIFVLICRKGDIEQFINNGDKID